MRKGVSESPCSAAGGMNSTAQAHAEKLGQLVVSGGNDLISVFILTAAAIRKSNTAVL